MSTTAIFAPLTKEEREGSKNMILNHYMHCQLAPGNPVTYSTLSLSFNQ